MNQTQYQGVCPYGNQFRAQVFRAGRVFYLGLYATPELAAGAYDRGAKISAPWSKRRVRYNFAEPIVDRAKDVLTRQETEMLRQLRESAPMDELAHDELGRIDAMVPADLLRECSGFAGRFEAMGEQLRGYVQKLESVLRNVALEAKEKEANLEFLRTRIKDLEAKVQVYELRTDPKSPSSIFKRVVPKAPVLDASTPLPGTGSVETPQSITS